MSTNIRVQDLDLLPGVRVDERRLEVVADGLPLFHGAQLAVDTTIVCTVRGDGAPRRQCATTDGAALAQARRRKELRYPELTGEHSRSWWSWHVRLEGDGQMRLTTSSGSWHGRGPVLKEIALCSMPTRPTP